MNTVGLLKVCGIKNFHSANDKGEVDRTFLRRLTQSTNYKCCNMIKTGILQKLCSSIQTEVNRMTNTPWLQMLALLLIAVTTNP